MCRHETPPVRRRLALVLTAGLVISAAAGCGREDDRLAAVSARVERALVDGQVDTALADARIAGQDAAAAGRADWADRFRLLEAEALVLARSAGAADRLATPVTAAASDREALEARRAYLLAQLDARRLGESGRLGDALPALEEVARRARAAGATGTALDADLLRAQVLARTRRLADAEALLAAVRREARAAGDARREAAALNNLGVSRFLGRRYDEALEYLTPILDLREIESSALYGGALTNAGICHAQLGDFPRAISLLERAAGRSASPAYLHAAVGELGSTYALAGQTDRAMPYLERALEIAIGANLRVEAALWAGNLAAASVTLGRWDDASRYNDEAIRLKTLLKLPTLVYNQQTAARIAAGRGQAADARARFTAILATRDLDPSVAWEAHAGLARVLFEQGDGRAAIREYDRALAVIARTRSELLRTEQQFLFPSRLRHFYDDYVDALVAAGLDETALEVAEASRAQVLAARQGVAAFARQSAATFRAMATRHEVVLLSYWLGRERSHAWVTAASGIRRIDLPAARVIGPLVARYRSEVEGSLADPIATAASAGTALADLVLTPVLPSVPVGSRVVVVADGALHDVNLEMLPVGSPRRYWIQDVTIEVAPSAGLLATAGPRPPGRRDVLLIGDPTPPSPEFAPLAHAGAELDAIASALAERPVTAHRSAAATPAAYRASDPGRFGVIHFAAHATVSAASPLDSAIELSPVDGGGYKLYARDVAALPLEADLVTISACRSAAARAYASEGLVGFAWAFLRAGADRVVAGLWDVDDRSTSLLMAAFYREVGRGAPIGAALRTAKLDLISRGGNFAKPYYWAPFQVFAAVPPGRPAR